MITVIKDKTDSANILYEALTDARSSDGPTFKAEFTNINPNIKIGFFCDNMDALGLDLSDADLTLFYTYNTPIAFYTYFTPVTFNGRLL